ncbi:hypothetical protein GE21DRAFT_1304035 [Neurospora crassa]|nr:hypothetical protein GE21DRAFT_1304035 [Neurospora crassa]
MAFAEPVEIGTKCTTRGNVERGTLEQISTKRQEANERSGPLQVLPSVYLQGDNIHIHPGAPLGARVCIARNKIPRQGWNKEKTIHFVGYETDDANEREKIAVAVVDPKDDFDIRLADWRHPMGIQWVLAVVGSLGRLVCVLERPALGSVLLLLAEDACSIQWKPSNLILQVDGECGGRDATSNCV